MKGAPFVFTILLAFLLLFNENALPAVDDQDYFEAYYKEVNLLNSEYGVYTEGSTTQIEHSGFAYGALIDYDEDGTPEFLCIYKEPNTLFHRVRLYCFVNGHADMLMDIEAGNELFGDNVSSICFCKINEKPFLWVENCEWGTIEKISVYTVNNGSLWCQKFQASVEWSEIEYIDANGSVYFGGPGEVIYYDCSIDDKPVDVETYEKNKKLYMEDVEYWEYPTPEDAIKFMQELEDKGTVRNH